MFDNRYTAHPKHIFYPIIFLAIGTYTLQYDGWLTFVIVVYLLSFSTGMWIVYAGIVRERTEYWEVITSTAEQLDRTNNPEVWEALGFKVSPKKVEVVIDKTPVENKKAGVKNIEFQKVPISPAKLRMFAQGVLNGSPLSFSKWGGKGKLFTDKEYREFHQYMRVHKWIEKSNPEHERQGYKLTEQGEEILRKIVGEAIRNTAPNLVQSLKSV